MMTMSQKAATVSDRAEDEFIYILYTFLSFLCQRLDESPAWEEKECGCTLFLSFAGLYGDDYGL